MSYTFNPKTHAFVVEYEGYDDADCLVLCREYVETYEEAVKLYEEYKADGQYSYVQLCTTGVSIVLKGL